jgi:hypothetical protein
LTDSENFSMADDRHRTQKDKQFSSEIEKYFGNSVGTTLDKLQNFSKFVSRQDLSLFLARDVLFKQIIDTHGYIIDCGVHLGSSLMTWAQLSAIYEPYNHMRRVVGFDTFSGFTKIHEKDKGSNSEHCMEGGMSVDAYDDLNECIRLYDLNRPLGHVPKIELVKGDAVKTIPQYVGDNSHLVVAMLYLDFVLYEPTKIAIEQFLPRMPKGSIIAFDELNAASWPGETQAILETVGISNLRIKRMPFTPWLSYAVLE